MLCKVGPNRENLIDRPRWVIPGETLVLTLQLSLIRANKRPSVQVPFARRRHTSLDTVLHCLIQPVLFALPLCLPTSAALRREKGMTSFPPAQRPRAITLISRIMPRVSKEGTTMVMKAGHPLGAEPGLPFEGTWQYLTGWPQQRDSMRQLEDIARVH